MAKIKEITVSTKRTIGLPGYSSVGKEAFVTLSLDEGEDYKKVYRHAWKLVEDQVKEQLRSFIDPDWIDEDVPGEAETRERSTKMEIQAFGLNKKDSAAA